MTKAEKLREKFKTMTEMVANAYTIANASNCPVICDADTGYGNELNMTRTVHEFERAALG